MKIKITSTLFVHHTKCMVYAVFACFMLGSLSLPAQSLNFDGNGDYATLPGFDFYTSEFTIEGWIKADAGDGAIFVCNDNTDLSTGVHIAVANFGALRFFYRNPPGNAGGVNIFSATNVVGEWHHFAAVYDTDSKLSIYIDGVLETTSASSISPLASGALSIFNIGFNAPSSPRYFNGNMDDLRIWDYARTEAEISANMTCELDGDDPGLVAYYDFNQGTPGGDNTSETMLTAIVGPDGSFNGFALDGNASNFVTQGPSTACSNDSDGDGVNDDVDNCPNDPNPEQVDADFDGTGDACDLEFGVCSFVDGMSNYIEGLDIAQNYKTVLINRLNLTESRYCAGYESQAKNLMKAFRTQVIILENIGYLSASEADFLTLRTDAFTAAADDGTATCECGGNLWTPPVAYSLMASDLNVSPNPASEILNVSFAEITEPTTISIVNTFGQMVWQADIEPFQSSLEIDLNSGRFTNGVYFVTLHGVDGTQTQRVVISR